MNLRFGRGDGEIFIQTLMCVIFHFFLCDAAVAQIEEKSPEGGQGVDPRNVIRISFLGRISVPGRNMLRFLVAGQGCRTRVS